MVYIWMKKEYLIKVFDIVKDYQEKFEKAVNISVLPNEPDINKINELRSNINEMIILDNIKNKDFIENLNYDNIDIERD